MISFSSINIWVFHYARSRKRDITMFAIMTILLSLLTPAVSGREPVRLNIPKGYVCYRADEPLTLNGKLDDPSWSNAPWTDYFVDQLLHHQAGLDRLPARI